MKQAKATAHFPEVMLRNEPSLTDNNFKGKTQTLERLFSRKYKQK
jgi:hypothetical protein